MNWKNIALVLAGLLVGCAGGTAGRALADYPPTAPRFQHMCMGPNGIFGASVNERVAKAGDEGWELVAMTEGVVCFKRPR